MKDDFFRHFPNLLIVDGVGASESGGNGLLLCTKGKTQMIGGGPTFKPSPGTVVLDDELRVLEPGSERIGKIARTGHIPLAYYKDPVKSAETFFTAPDGQRYSMPGDFARVEADGQVTLLGRGSVSINSGGEKIYPEEVEQAIKSHPDAYDAVVIGVPDERFGNRVAAIVQPRPGATLTLDDLQAHCRKHIAGYKVPRQLTLVDADRALAGGQAGLPLGEARRARARAHERRAAPAGRRAGRRADAHDESPRRAQRAVARDAGAHGRGVARRSATRKDLHVAILTGAGDTDFCAGGDLKLTMPLVTGARQPETEWDARLLADMTQFTDAILRGFELYKPVIAAVNGSALGGGTEMANACDLRVAAEHAVFGTPEAKVGLLPGGGSLTRLPRQIPYALAMEMLLIGDPVSAQQALAMGLVNYVVPRAQLMDKARELAAKIAANGPLAVRKIKEGVRARERRPDRAGTPDRERSLGRRDELEGRPRRSARLPREAQAQLHRRVSCFVAWGRS